MRHYKWFLILTLPLPAGFFFCLFPKIHMEAMAVQWNVGKADAGLKKI